MCRDGVYTFWNFVANFSVYGIYCSIAFSININLQKETGEMLQSYMSFFDLYVNNFIEMLWEALAEHSEVCIFIYYVIRFTQLTHLGVFSACL